MTVAIVLRPITKENWETAAKLEVREDQQGYVAPNVWSIAESQFHPWIRPMAIYNGGTMVGFLVYGRDPADGEYWLYRYMIDRRFQGQGLGKAALQALIAHLRSLPDCDSVTVGYQPENLVAERLYLGFGFEKGDPAPWGESTARLKIGPIGPARPA
jgi:diamine N-acetyltransferase